MRCGAGAGFLRRFIVFLTMCDMVSTKRLQVGAVRLLDDVLRQPVHLKPLYGRGGKQVLAGEHDIVGELDQLLRKRDDLILKLTRKMPGINVE